MLKKKKALQDNQGFFVENSWTFELHRYARNHNINLK